MEEEKQSKKTTTKKKSIPIAPITFSKDQEESHVEFLNGNTYYQGNVIVNRNGMSIINQNQNHIFDIENLFPNPNIQELINRVIYEYQNNVSPQQFIIPIRFPAQCQEKDKDGFFIPIPKKKNQNQQQEYQQSQQQSASYQNEQFFQISIHDLKKLQPIGNGSSGVVYSAVHIPTNTFMALKVINEIELQSLQTIKIITEQNFYKQINLELSTLVSCNHQNIIKCYGAFLEHEQITIALEYMDLGTLTELIRKYGFIPEVMLGQIAYQILQGLDYLHKYKKLIHRDIKPSNLLVNSEGFVKISDFGVSGQLMNSKDQRNTWIGTVTYMSPERFRGEPYSSDTDIWSVGLSLLECAWGRFPYPEDGQQKVLGFWELMEHINQKQPPKFPPSFSNEMQEFISICMRKDGGSRLTASQLLQHPAMSQYEGVSLDFFKNWLKA